MKRGRPTTSQSISLEEQIHKCYSRGLSAETVSHHLKLDRKTVYAYFKKFSDRIIAINETNFFEETQARIKQNIISYDNLLLEFYSMLDSINFQLDQKDANMQSLQNQKLSVLREIRNILNGKANLEPKMRLELILFAKLKPQWHQLTCLSILECFFL